MALIDWNEELDVGIRAIDDHHRGLADALNSLHAAIEAQAPSASSSALLKALASKTVAHFASEEALMAETSYPGLVSHKAIHDVLLAQLQEIGARAKAGEPFSTELTWFLKGWLVDHILGTDRLLAAFLAKRGVH